MMKTKTKKGMVQPIRMNWVYYFAYGSNMNPDRMWYRVPSARAVGVGTLHGWKLVERLYADIEARKGCETEGVIYALTLGDLERLDHFEGAPNVYARKMVRVDIAGGRSIQAITYVMTNETRRERDGMPYPDDYREVCSHGADAFGVKNGFERTKEVA